MLLNPQSGAHYYASSDAVTDVEDDCKIPDNGNSGHHCYRMLSDYHTLDCRERLNTASYVNVHLEDDEIKAANLGLKINIADQTTYPSSMKVHNLTLNMIANLWNCPKPPDFDQHGIYPGSATVGSTEACLLGGLCFKFRWRKWYAKRHGLTGSQVRAVYPNLVVSTLFQAAWEKLFRYMDVEAKFVSPSSTTFAVSPEAIREQIDEKTIGVVAILGNHYGGHYDPVWEIDAMLQALNKEKGWQVGIHVDAASGGFVAPFQENVPAWDFRLPTVLSISASGHKFGESVCGTGWVVWRERTGLSEYVNISVSYLGGQADSYTLNFSRPASGFFVQFYKFHRLGLSGFRALRANQFANAKYLRDGLRSMRTPDDRPRFRLLDAGDRPSLPVVTACLNPDCDFPYDDIDFQHQMQQHHWFISGYKMNYHDPNDELVKPLFNDVCANQTMFRVVVKANLTRNMVQSLLESIRTVLRVMDSLGPGFANLHNPKKQKTGHKGHTC